MIVLHSSYPCKNKKNGKQLLYGIDELLVMRSNFIKPIVFLIKV